MKLNIGLSVLAGSLSAAGSVAQTDLNSLRKREWAHSTAEIGAIWRIDDHGGTDNVKLKVVNAQSQQQIWMSLDLPMHRLGGVAFIPYTPTAGGPNRKFELVVGGVVNSFPNGVLPVVTGLYSRVIVDYVPTANPVFTGSVVETVSLGGTDPIAIGWAGFGSSAPDRVALHDGRGRRLLFASTGLGSGLLPLTAYTESLASFPLGWMRRGIDNQLDLSHPDGVLRINHVTDPSRYLKVKHINGSWVATPVDRPTSSAGAVSSFKFRFTTYPFSANSLPDVFVPGSSGTATMTLHDATGSTIGSSMSVAKGQWATLPSQAALHQHVGDPVAIRVNGETRTEKVLVPMCRFGAPYSTRTGFEVSPSKTQSKYSVGTAALHGFHVLNASSAGGQLVFFQAAYAVWDRSATAAPVVASGVPGVDLIAAQAVVGFQNVEMDRINGGLGLDIAIPDNPGLDGLVLLCQYFITFADNTVAVTDICGTVIRSGDESRSTAGGLSGPAIDSFLGSLASRGTDWKQSATITGAEAAAFVAMHKQRIR